MKIRTDFVTNSSSSSFVIVSKIKNRKELEDYMRDEYGKYGERLLKECLAKGCTVCREYNRYPMVSGYYISEDCADTLRNDPDGDYLAASFIAWTNDGDTNGDDAWLYDHIPDEYKEKIYESEPD